MVCVICCSDPKGAGTAKTMNYFKTSGMFAKNGGYTGVGELEMRRCIRVCEKLIRSNTFSFCERVTCNEYRPVNENSVNAMISLFPQL